LNGQGVGVMALVSFTSRKVERTCGHWGRRRAEDAYSALDWLVTNGHAKADDATLIGQSNGGLATLMAAEWVYHDHPNRFKAAVALVPSGKWQLNTKFATPLLILAAEQDDANRADKCEALAQHERPADSAPVMLIVYKRAYHAYMDPIIRTHTFNGWRVGCNHKAAHDTLKVVESVIAGNKIEYRK
jgi:dienelactone hydrolase